MSEKIKMQGLPKPITNSATYQTVKDFFERDIIALYEQNRTVSANLLMRLKLVVTNDIPTAGVCVLSDGINLFVNPKFYLEELKTKAQNVKNTTHQDLRIDLLKHEVGHIFGGHVFKFRKKRIEEINHGLTNQCMDATINETLPKLTAAIEGACTNERLSELYKIDLKPRMNYEYYFNSIFKDQKDKGNTCEMKGEGNAVDVHGELWGQSDVSQEEAQDIVKGQVKRSYESARNAGNISGDEQQLVDKLLKSQINWKQQLRKVFTDTISFKKKQTRKRPNRRMEFLVPGRKKKYESTLLICCDTSGSVSDGEFAIFWNEIKAIHDTGSHKIMVAMGDTEVKGVEEFNSKSKPDRKGYGGTNYQPFIDLAKEMNIGNLIIFGDGGCFDTPKKPKCKMNVTTVYTNVHEDTIPWARRIVLPENSKYGVA